MSRAEQGPDIDLHEVRLTLGHTRFHFHGSIKSGCITGVIGPSGSGKSTLLNLVSGFERPDTGRILFGRQDMTLDHPSKRPVSLIFQDNNLFGHLDLFTNIGLGIHPSLRLSRVEQLAVSEALARVGLAGMEKRKPATLSGGEKQRAAFARALVRQKPVLLMDEPFAALDPGLRFTMATLLAELHEETKSTVLIVTHDPNEVRRIAHNVVFIDDGRILLNSAAADLPAHQDIPAVASFLAS